MVTALAGPAQAGAALLSAIALLCWPGSPARPRLRALSPPAPVGARRPWRLTSGRLPVGPLTVVVAAVLAWSVWGAGAGVAVGATVGFGLRRYRATSSRRRDAAQVTALLDAIGLLVSDLRVGAHPAAAAAAAASSGNEDAHRVLAAVAAGARLGAPVPRLLERQASSRVAIGDCLRRLASAWALAEAHGVALADLVEAVRADLEARQRMGAELHAQLAGPRATALVLAGLPVLGVALGEGVGAGPVGVLTGTGVGQILLVVGTALACAGVLWSERILAGAARP